MTYRTKRNNSTTLCASIATYDNQWRAWVNSALMRGDVWVCRLNVNTTKQPL